MSAAERASKPQPWWSDYAVGLVMVAPFALTHILASIR